MKAGDRVKLVGAAAEVFPDYGIRLVVDDAQCPPTHVSVTFAAHEKPLLLNRRLVALA